MRPPFFSVDCHQANLQPNLLLFNFPLRFNPIPTFLEITFDCTLSFSKRVSSLKAKFFLRLKALRFISASSWDPSKKSISLFCIKLFFGLCSLMLHPDCFLFLALPTLPNRNVFTEWLVAPPPAVFRPAIPTSLLPHESF